MIHWNYSNSTGGMTVYAAECVIYFFFFPFPPFFFFNPSILLDEVINSAQDSALAGSAGVPKLVLGMCPKIDVCQPNGTLFRVVAGTGTFGGEYGTL